MAKRTPAKPTPLSAAARLDELVPLVQPEQLEVHQHAAILEVSSPAQLLELAMDRAFAGLLLCRLSPTVALIDPGTNHEVIELLRRRGHTPKVT
ncbi:hypothetical protein BH10PLA2_BH10PLA2_16690 [soil metagenome]